MFSSQTITTTNEVQINKALIETDRSNLTHVKTCNPERHS